MTCPLGFGTGIMQIFWLPMEMKLIPNLSAELSLDEKNGTDKTQGLDRGLGIRRAILAENRFLTKRRFDQFHEIPYCSFQFRPLCQ